MIQIANGTATRPIASTPMATLGAGMRRAARPPVKSATPRVAAAPRAAAGERNWFRPPILAPATCRRSGRPATPHRFDPRPVAAHRLSQRLGVAVLAVDVAMHRLHALAHGLGDALDGFFHQALCLLHRGLRVLDELGLDVLEPLVKLAHVGPHLHLAGRTILLLVP